MQVIALEPDVVAAQAGDREAFARLVDAYRNVVCSIVTAVLRDLEASEDVAQEVFVAAWTGLGKLRNPASFLPWLRQLARNQARFFARTRARRLRREQAADHDDVLASVADPSPSATQTLVTAEQLELLAEALDELPDDAREVVTLYYREGRSARQVAELLGIREDAVKKRLERARALLRRELLERFGETIERTAPGAAFTAAVAAALSVAAPATASAATTAMLVSATPLGKLALGLSGVGLGLLGGLGGIVMGLRSGLRRARDERERRELRGVAITSGLLIIPLCLGIQASAVLRSPVLLLVLWFGFLPLHSWLYLRRMPQIVARRHAAERAEDASAEHRHRRELRRARIGFGVGVGTGTATVLWAAWVLAQG